MAGKNVLFRVAALLIAGMVGLTVCEIAFRTFRYQQLVREISFEDTRDIFDQHTGFRYTPNQVNTLYPTESCLSPRVWRVNRHGHIADMDYPVEKPSTELRIAVIGDSFTAGVTNSVRWTSVLEERLNQSQAWRDKSNKTTRVLNLGLDGIGVGQFREVFDREAVRFEPDIVLVNLIADDLRRRRYFRGKPAQPEEEKKIQEWLRHELLDPLPWFGFHSEILAVTRIGRPFGMRTRLEPRFYSDADEAMSVSLASLRHIVSQHPKVIILHHPMNDEYRRGLDSFRARLVKRMYAEGSDLRVVCMKEQLPDPTKTGFDPVAQWYQWPLDSHPNDAGMVAYGEAVSNVLMRGILP